jgi:hypothetical protein
MSNPYYDICALTMRLHLLIAGGRSDSEAADALRDQMDSLYLKLAPHEKADVRVWSALMYEFETYKSGKPVVRPQQFCTQESRANNDSSNESEKIVLPVEADIDKDNFFTVTDATKVIGRYNDSSSFANAMYEKLMER